MVQNEKTKLLVSDLWHIYYGPRSTVKLLALKNVNLAAYDGEFVAVVGPSGCGKTTLLNVTAGLLKPTKGTVVVEGSLVDGPDGRTGFVFQDPLLLPWKTLLENVSWGLELRGMPRSEAYMKAGEVLRFVGLSGFENYYPHSLSGGMQQRANLARALVLDPEILLMDEPLASLDAQTREIMQRELARVFEAEKRTILFVTHDISEAVYLADRVYVLTKRPGRVKDVVPIDLPRPRAPSLKRSSEFMEYTARLWDLLELSMA